MEKNFIYSTTKFAGDVLFNTKTKETTMVLNLGFAGRHTFFLANEKMTGKNGEVMEVVALRKYINNNGNTSSVKVGCLFPSTSKSGTQYHNGSFGLCSVYNAEKEKNLIEKEDMGITLQLFKLTEDKRKVLSDSVIKVGFVNMQLYVAEANTTNEGTYQPQPQQGMEGTSIREEEIPF